ncbi:unnamed protein product [Microthlaspi erraticum]|uniref:Uncharacterized protein n=1 Tax=Microthlaspi erraticum TaxID=1685480 RepID=A0A6D2IRH8_9BRAS|nr:unnamed protein product [Microthlaspi erraticum]
MSSLGDITYLLKACPLPAKRLGRTGNLLVSLGLHHNIACILSDRTVRSGSHSPAVDHHSSTVRLNRSTKPSDPGSIVVLDSFLNMRSKHPAACTGRPGN